MKLFIKTTLSVFCAMLDWLLRLRHVSCETRLGFFSACRDAAREFYHNGRVPEAAVCNDADVLGRTLSAPGKPRILVDVTQMVKINGRSGIQRVVVRILDAMLPDDRCVYVPVANFNGHMYYVEYHQKDCSFHLTECLRLMKADTLLMLDSSWDSYDAFRKIFKQLRSLGGKICVAVYDLGPVLCPRYANVGVPKMFDSWLRAAVLEADEMLCISKTVADQLRDYIIRHSLPRSAAALKIGHFYLGADFAQEEVQLVDWQVAEIAHRLKSKKKFLSVSTLEPRKNYDFMLQVMEKLWEREFDVVYFIVGRKGWKSDELIRKITGHPELNKRLFWFPCCNDGTLQLLYRSADVLLNLSHDEGFGLSLVEGALHHCALIASDIPVFREVLTDHTVLFCNIDSLEETVESIAARLEADQFVPSEAKCWLWQDSLTQILDALLHDRWDFTVEKKSEGTERDGSTGNC